MRIVLTNIMVTEGTHVVRIELDYQRLLSHKNITVVLDAKILECLHEVEARLSDDVALETSFFCDDSHSGTAFLKS